MPNPYHLRARIARHKLRDLYDTPEGSPSSLLLPLLPLGRACPALVAGGWGEGSPSSQEEDPLEEDDDPW